MVMNASLYALLSKPPLKAPHQLPIWSRIPNVATVSGASNVTQHGVVEAGIIHHLFRLIHSFVSGGVGFAEPR